MTIKALYSHALILLVLLSTSVQLMASDASNPKQEPDATPGKFDKYSLPGAMVMAFGPDNVLFVGDSKSGVVHAIETQATEMKNPFHYNLFGIDQKIAKALKIDPQELMINDMKIHPVSQEAYIAVKRGFEPDAPAMIAIVSPPQGEVRLLDISASKRSKVALDNPVNPDLKFWDNVSASSLNITDLDYHDGFLYVAGLTNGEFASTLRKIPYPFTGEHTNVAGIEIWHAVHTQKETRAPIRTMLIDEVNGDPTLVASYTCTPLVTIPLSEVKEGNHIKGKTVAELGYGNAPLDMISFMAQEMDGSFDKKLLVVHKNRGGSLISFKDLAEADKGEGMKGFSMGPEGVNIFQVSTGNLMQLDDQNQMMVALLRRNMSNGTVELISQMKGSYLRLSDFISEYDFPDYEYSEQQAKTKQYHDMIKPMEGYPHLTSDKE